MLGLGLRDELKGRRLKGTSIELKNSTNTGATQIPAAQFLEITYPSIDLLKSIEAIDPKQGRPAVLCGERGQGKSHILAALHHALENPETTKKWLSEWANRLQNPNLAKLALRDSVHVISESLHHQSYKYLWDLLFERHPNGSWAHGKWEGAGDKKTPVPPYALLRELFEKRPTALILDEYQTWYDGLVDSKQQPLKTWAFNFIQLLSEISQERPDLLVLVVSVRNGQTNAFQQIQRVNPIIVDFKGPAAKRDRKRLLLHRLFENRAQIHSDDVRNAITSHVGEVFRLLDTPPAEQQHAWDDFIESWPFAPHLIQLLEDQVLVATNAQETRDLIRILASLFKRNENAPIITAADFRLDEDDSGIEALLDSVANQHHAKLRERAQRNLSAVKEAVRDPDNNVPHLKELVGALWVRSIAVGNQVGASADMLQVDITRTAPIDDNAFKVELDTIVENSFNIHIVADRLVFKEEENPQAKLMANARNDKLFTEGQDTAQLALEIRYVLVGEADVAGSFRVIVLPQDWHKDPWGCIDENERPENWDDRIPLLVLPETPDKLNSRLGPWLKNHLQFRRNAVRFLLPIAGSPNVFTDRNLLILARAIYLANSWKQSNREYEKLHRKYEGELRNVIKNRYDRFAILETWNFADPSRCRFHESPHKAQGSKIPEAVDKYVRESLFIPEDFEELVLAASDNNDTASKLLKELQEPRPNEQECIPWLGETLVKEQIIRLCAKGKIAINLRGMEYLQRADDETEDAAWRRMRGRLGTGKHLEETHILRPQAIPATGGVQPPGGGQGALFGGGSQPGGMTTAPTAAGAGVSATAGTSTPVGSPPDVVTSGGIFGGSAARVPLSAPANSSLNLLGQLELWGVNPGSQLHDLNLRVTHLTGAQLQKILRTLPDGLKYEINLEKEEG